MTATLAMTGTGDPFIPKGAKAEWELLYDALLAEVDFGAVITYRQLDEVLGRPFRQNRGPIYRATKHLGAMRHRWLAPVPNVGYRVITAKEHMREADRHKRKGGTQLAIAGEVLKGTELSVLTAPELTAWDQQTRITAALVAMWRAHDDRLLRLEAIMQQHEQRIETVELLGGTRRV